MAGKSEDLGLTMNQDDSEGHDYEDGLPPGPDNYPPIDFTTFVLSLSTSALVHLGEAIPGVDAREDLALARQTIDLLGILEQKTRGNLSGEEERLLTQVPSDLRLKYVEKSKQPHT